MASCGAEFNDEKHEFEIFPTIVPAEDFDADADAKVLQRATQGLGTDEKTIIWMISRRSTEQLKEVETQYKTLFGDDLKKTLESELRGDLEKVVLGRFYGRFEYQAWIARRAMKGVGTDEQALIDVVCSKNPNEMNKIKDVYKDMYERDLIKDIESETSGHLGRILVSMATANREDKPVDYKQAEEEAQMLYDAGEGMWGTDEKVFNQIFAARSHAQLKLIFLFYRKLTGVVIFDAIDKEMSGKLRSAFLTIARYIADPITYYSEMMFEAMEGVGTDDERLIRAVVSRCEIDLKTVRERYDKLHDIALKERIEKETRGDYETALVALIGG